MNLGVSFAPLVPAYVVWAAFGVAFVLSATAAAGAQPRRAGARHRARPDGAGARQSVADTRRPRPDPLGRRRHHRQEPEPGFRRPQRRRPKPRTTTLVERLKRIPGLEVRVSEAGRADGETDGTRLFSALSSTLADVPPDRVAGAIMITDGRVHDVPADAAALGFAAPLHALITGHADERDRRVVLTRRRASASSASRRPSASASRIRAPAPAPRRSPSAATARCSKQRVVAVAYR